MKINCGFFHFLELRLTRFARSSILRSPWTNPYVPSPVRQMELSWCVASGERQKITEREEKSSQKRNGSRDDSANFCRAIRWRHCLPTGTSASMARLEGDGHGLRRFF